MANIKSTNLRFNLDKEIHRKAWEYLQNIGKSQFQSYTHAIAVAVVNYFEKSSHDDVLMSQIIGAVEGVLDRKISNNLAGIAQSQPTQEQLTAEKTVESGNEYIDFDFIGG